MGRAIAKPIYCLLPIEVTKSTIINLDVTDLEPEIGITPGNLGRALNELSPDRKFQGGQVIENTFEPLIQRGLSWIARLKPSTGAQYVIYCRWS